MKIGLIHQPSLEWREYLHKNFKSRFFLKGEQLFKEGDLAEGLLFIYSGKIKVYKSRNNGSEEILRIAGEGDFLGYNKSILNSKYASSAKALEDTITIIIPKSEFLKVFR